jgi:hypothetical protein
MLAMYKAQLSDPEQKWYKFPHEINENIELDMDTLRFQIQTGNYNTLFSLKYICKWWCLELLNKKEEPTPLYFQAFE